MKNSPMWGEGCRDWCARGFIPAVVLRPELIDQSRNKRDVASQSIRVHGPYLRPWAKSTEKDAAGFGIDNEKTVLVGKSARAKVWRGRRTWRGSVVAT